MRDVSPAQANWWPPGRANSIGATFLHVVINPDIELNWLLYGRDPLIERDWAGAVGEGVAYDPDRFDAWVPGLVVDWERLRNYGRAVGEWLIASLDGVTESVLTRPVDMSRAGLGIWTGRRLYDLHGIHHVYTHGGEIACLKGLQGLKGYRGGVDLD